MKFIVACALWNLEFTLILNGLGHETLFSSQFQWLWFFFAAVYLIIPVAFTIGCFFEKEMTIH